MKKQPLVSIIMPVFNAGAFLGEAIESIVYQTYQHIELLIVDDASEDNTKEIISDYQKKFPHIIKPLSLQTHAGDSSASNLAYKKAQGSFIARMDGDDISHAQRIEKQVTYLLQNPRVLVVGTQGFIINEKNHILGEKNYPLSHERISEVFGMVNAMMHPSCMFRKSMLSKDKLYEGIFPIGDDYLTFFKLLHTGIFANLPDRLHFYRLHRANSSLKNPKQQFFFSLLIRKKAWQDYNYRFSFNTLCIILLQVIFVVLLPQQAIVPLYLYIRGIYSPFVFFKQMLRPPSPPLLISSEA